MIHLNVMLMAIACLEKIDTEAKIATFKVPDIGIESQLQLGSMRAMGKHNYYNAAVAALSVAGLDVGVQIEDINSTIEKLRPPPHRMQVGKCQYIVILGHIWITN